MTKWEMIKSECIAQSKLFQRWHDLKKYATFHSSHYDWWTFPVDQPSSYRDKYQIGPAQRTPLLEDSEFVEALRVNAILVCTAWGYDLKHGHPIANTTGAQEWQRWPIRLYKMTNSLQIFQQWDLHINAVRYGLGLIKTKGQKFVYRGRDLQAYFRARDPTKNTEKREKKTDMKRQQEGGHTGMRAQQEKIEQSRSAELHQQTKPKLPSEEVKVDKPSCLSQQKPLPKQSNSLAQKPKHALQPSKPSLLRPTKPQLSFNQIGGCEQEGQEVVNEVKDSPIR